MRVDWITVAAQIVNFLVLAWLLRRFLYQPILQAMARREQRIADRLHEAARRQEEAEAEAQKLREKQAALARERDAVIAEARSHAEQERRTLEEEARAEADRKRREWLDQLDSQRETFLAELRQRSTAQFFALARRALADLADAPLEERIAAAFLRELEALDKPHRDRISRAAARAGNAVTVRSRFELPPSTRRELTRAIHGLTGAEAQVAYSQDEALGAGIELAAGGQVVAWTLDRYLDGLAKAVAERLGEVAAPAAAAEAAAAPGAAA